MKEKKLLERFVLDPAVMTGKPIITETRLTVEGLCALVAKKIFEDK